MLWFLFVPVAFVLITREMWTGWMKPEGFIDGMISVLATLLLTGLSAGGCAIVAALIGTQFPSEAVQVSDKVLVAIRDKDGVSGQFFLGSGIIKGDQYYFYYATLPDGGFQPGKVYAGDGCRVYEEERADAHLITYRWIVKSEWARLIALPVNDGGYSYDFHVPKGTIRTGFTM